MNDVLTIIAVTSGAFIGTNLDNLILLIALYSRYENQSRIVTAGYMSGMVVIGVISLVIGFGGEFVPVTYLGLLGVIPISMGVFALLQLFRTRRVEVAADFAMENSVSTIFIAVLMTQLSNGADSIVTFSVFLADSTPASDYLIILTFLVMVCVFSGVAYYSLKHRGLSKILDRYGRYVTPFILILVGFYIISNTASDLVPG
jgi:cadmium resistance protein CadD (predicted permease)